MQYNSDPKKAASLVAIPQYFDLDVFSELRADKASASCAVVYCTYICVVHAHVTHVYVVICMPYSTVQYIHAYILMQGVYTIIH